MAVVSTASPEPFRPRIWSDLAPAQQALECLEAEITELWGHINAANYRFLALVGDYDRRQGWALHGLVNCAQWLNWQCGIGEVAAREKVRVARALETLPRISDSFRRGVISYSKVRAMTRVASPENEADLLNIAECGTAAHVERLVRKYARAERLADAARANELHRTRCLRFFHDEDGSLVVYAKLPPEIGEVVRKAIEEAVKVVEEKERADEAAETRPNVPAETFEAEPGERAPEHPLGAKRVDALRLLADAFLTRQSDACGSVADRFQVVVHVDQELLAGLATSGELGTERCEVEDGRALALETVRRLGCDCSVVGMVDDADGEPLSVGRKSRSIPPALARALKARDGGCRFPGCGRTRFTEGHHVVHWADGGETKIGNLITLCRFHHRLVHEGGFGLHVLDDGAERDMFVFTRPDGTRIEPNGRQCSRGNNSLRAAEDAALGDAPGQPSLFALNREQGLAIDWQTSRCKWLGESMDYCLAVQALQQRKHAARPWAGELA